MGAWLRKETAFEGFPSGDMECFCFDRRTKAQRDNDERPGLLPRTRYRRAEAARIYPHDFLPPEAAGRYGRWRITVEFEPEDLPMKSEDPK